MKICIFGMGAVGGHFGARLAAAGHDVSAVARGKNLAALKRDGITLHSLGETITAPVRASDDARDLGEQNLVISTLKATGLPDLAQDVAPLLGPDTPVVFAQNGIPGGTTWGCRPTARRRPTFRASIPVARCAAPSRRSGSSAA